MIGDCEFSRESLEEVFIIEGQEDGKTQVDGLLGSPSESRRDGQVR